MQIRPHNHNHPVNDYGVYGDIRCGWRKKRGRGFKFFSTDIYNKINQLIFLNKKKGYEVLFWLNKKQFMYEFIAIVVRMQKFALLFCRCHLEILTFWQELLLLYIYGLRNVKMFFFSVCQSLELVFWVFAGFFVTCVFEFWPLEKIKNNIWTFSVFFFHIISINQLRSTYIFQT